MGRKRSHGSLSPILNLLFLLLIFHLHVATAVSSASIGSDPGPRSLAENDSKDADAVAALFVFGDSFLDIGNNNYINTTTLDKANCWPYGESYFDYPTGRFSDGRVVPDFIAEKARLPLIPPFLQSGMSSDGQFGANFASAGAGVLVETFRGSVIDLKTQLSYFEIVESRMRQKLGKSNAKIKLAKAVYIFGIGSNDYMSPFLTNSTSRIIDTYSTPTYVEMVIGNLTNAIKEIYSKGGRKFAFINLPPLGCLPGLRIIGTSNSSDCFEQPSSLAKLHNSALSKLLVLLKYQLRGFKYSLYNFNGFLRQRISNPSKYGFVEGNGACCGTGALRGVFSCGGKRIVEEYELCGNPKQYLFWDSYHLTEEAYRQLSEEMWCGEGSTHKLSPYNLKNLFEGV